MGVVALVAVALLPLAPATSLAAPHTTSPSGTPELDVRPLDPAETAAVEEVAPGGEPSILYEEAMAHAADRIAFEAGGRVTVPFTPRADDTWPVGGGKARTLPAGRATGREMAATKQGARWASLAGAADPATTDPTPSAAPDASDGAPDAGSDPAGEDPAVGGDPADTDPAATPDPAAEPDPTPAPVDAPAGPAIPAEGASVATPDLTGDALTPHAASGLRKQVLGFLPYWEVPTAGPTLDYSVLSTIAYFSVGANSKGDLLKRSSDGTLTTGWSGWTSSKLTSIINAAHQRNTRVVLTLSVFAWTTSQANTQKALLSSSTARLNLARQAAAAVRDRGADGVNLDFEPLVSGMEDEYVAFVRTMRAELDKIAPGYQLTFDTTGWIGNYPLERLTAAGAADAVFVMGYDYRTASSGYAGSIDPLAGPAYDITDTVRAYTARVPGSKIILGVPWYGRAWSTVSDAVNAKSQSGTKYGSSVAVMYDDAIALAARYGRRWDSRESSPWVAYRRQNCTSTYGCVTSWRQVYYDDPTSLKLRYDVVNRYGLRGAGIWALGYDGGNAAMYTALKDRFLTDTVPPETGITALVQKQRDERFVVGWSAADQSPVVAYDVQVSVDGGAWQAWLTGTTATSEVYPGVEGHGYAFRVRARDAKGLWSAWNVSSVHVGSPKLAVGGFARVATDDLSYRTGPDTSAQRLGGLPAGTLVALTNGPRSADGYTWWEVSQPIREWGSVSFVERGVWIATASSTESFVTPSKAPNSTLVDAMLTDFAFGDGAASLGPTAAAVAQRAFSPDGDGRRDTLRVRWTAEATLATLDLVVRRADGTTVGTIAVPALGAGARTFTWDGSVGGEVLPDGTYALQLVGTLGNGTYRAPSLRPTAPAELARYGVVIDRVPPAIASATVTAARFSPNGDGRLDTAPLAFTATGGHTWELSVAPWGSSTAIRTIGGTGTAGSPAWDGRRTDGSVAPDGRYRLDLTVRDAAGNAATTSREVILDTQAPVLGSSASPVAFSPDGDGASETTTLAWTSNESAAGALRIYRDTTLVRQWAGLTGTSGSVVWDGRDRSGTLLADGRYTARLELRDAAGTLTRRDLTLTVDRTIGRLRWTRAFFPQDGDALAPTSAVSFRLARTATVSLRVVDAGGATVRTVYTERSLAAGTRSWTWDGRTSTGAWAPQGTYTAVLTARTSLGTMTLTRPVVAAAYRVSLSATTVRAGDTLRVTFRPVEALGSRAKVTFAQPGRAAVAAWAVKGTDGAYRVAFPVASGPAGTASVTISGTDTGGRTNRMALRVTVGG